MKGNEGRLSKSRFKREKEPWSSEFGPFGPLSLRQTLCWVLTLSPSLDAVPFLDGKTTFPLRLDERIERTLSDSTSEWKMKWTARSEMPFCVWFQDLTIFWYFSAWCGSVKHSRPAYLRTSLCPCCLPTSVKLRLSDVQPICYIEFVNYLKCLFLFASSSLY